MKEIKVKFQERFKAAQNNRGIKLPQGALMKLHLDGKVVAQVMLTQEQYDDVKQHGLKLTYDL